MRSEGIDGIGRRGLAYVAGEHDRPPSQLGDLGGGVGREVLVAVAGEKTLYGKCLRVLCRHLPRRKLHGKAKYW